MAQQIINVGTNPNDGTGDTLRGAFIKTDDNFTELYANKENVSNKSTTTTLGTSNTLYPTQNAVKTYVDTQVATKIGGSGTDNYIPRFNGTNALENSQIFDNGTNIGIGTTSPDAIFTINKTNANFTDASAGHILLDNSSASGQNSIYYRINGTVRGKTRVDVEGNFNHIANGGNHEFWTGGDAGVGSIKMKITSDGNVGINISSMSTAYTLQVKQKAANSYGGIINYANGSDAYIGMSHSDSVGYISTSYAASGAYTPLAFSTSDAERMRITSGGDVLIGTTTYGAVGVSFDKLGASIYNYNGTSSWVFEEFKNNNGTIGSISTNGTLTSYNVTSDYRLKQDFKNFNGLELLSKIKVYDYSWKVDNSRMNGVIAHELQEVVPYAVTGQKDAEQMQQVDYSKLVPILVQAIQELKAEIEILKTK